ncbi:MAG: dihydrodipicolinate reductase C-terminal domain-containing protein, partial [Elusimicrobiota bacterium]
MGQIRLAISGIKGRMGRAVTALVQADPDCLLAAGVLRRNSKTEDKIFFTNKVQEAMKRADVLIEFTNPEATLAHLQEIAHLKKPVVIGTTGFNPSQAEMISSYARSLAIVWDSNFSWGIALARRWLAQLESLPPGVDVGVAEIHRKGKKDRPSGTAKDLAGVIAASIGRNPDVVSLRLAEVRGEHEIYLAGPYESLKISHRVYS